jgi:hypothetical protein
LAWYWLFKEVLGVHARERAKLSPPPAEEQESDYRQEFRKSIWAACIKRIYEIDPLECLKCKAQMRIIAFISFRYFLSNFLPAITT